MIMMIVAKDYNDEDIKNAYVDLLEDNKENHEKP
jgi:hypothetical protein